MLHAHAPGPCPPSRHESKKTITLQKQPMVLMVKNMPSSSLVHQEVSGTCKMRVCVCECSSAPPHTLGVPGRMIQYRTFKFRATT